MAARHYKLSSGSHCLHHPLPNCACQVTVSANCGVLRLYKSRWRGADEFSTKIVRQRALHCAKSD